MKKHNGVTMVEIFVVICLVGLLFALLFPAINVARETHKKNLEKNSQLTTGVKDWHLFPEIFPEESIWEVSEKNKDGLKPVFYTNKNTGETVIALRKEVPKVCQIMLKGEMRPYTEELAKIYPINSPAPKTETPTTPVVKVEKE